MFVFQETGKLANKPELSNIYDFKAAAKYIGAYNTPDFYFVWYLTAMFSEYCIHFQLMEATKKKAKIRKSCPFSCCGKKIYFVSITRYFP